MRFLLLAGCISLTAGCASQPTPQPERVVVVPSPPETLIPDNEPIRVTAAVLGGDLSGAAYQMRGYRPVLRRDREGAYGGSTLLDSSYRPYAGMDRQLDKIEAPESETNRVRAPINSAWQRYCDGGRGMTKKDWAYVAAHGAPQGVPDRIAEACNYPK